MKLINFDSQYTQYADEWIRRNRAKYPNADQLEEAVFKVYMRWVNAPAKWLDGRSPGDYFYQYDDPGECVSILRAYSESDVPIPEQLLWRIENFGADATDALLRLTLDETADQGVRVIAFNLLAQSGDRRPVRSCIEMLLRAQAQDGLTEVAAELLQNLGRSALPDLLAVLDEAPPVAREVFLDILCNFPGDERIYTYTLDAFLTNAKKRALFASYLRKLNDPRAVGPLTQALEWEDLNYLDYIEIIGAIEALGGEIQSERDFDGDPYYESLKNTR